MCVVSAKQRQSAEADVVVRGSPQLRAPLFPAQKHQQLVTGCVLKPLGILQGWLQDLLQAHHAAQVPHDSSMHSSETVCCPCSWHAHHAAKKCSRGCLQGLRQPSAMSFPAGGASRLPARICDDHRSSCQDLIGLKAPLSWPLS